MLWHSTDTYLWIQVKIEQVHHKINHDDDQRQGHHAGLHHGEIKLPDGAHNEAARAGDSEDRLSDHRPT